MRVTRRTFVQLTLASAIPAARRRVLAQGVATHAAKPLARAAPSGRPFHARFVDVAAAAGLRAPIVYGAVEGHQYILETIGDRKSTRLNSSHTVISYAVFCLK